MPWCWTCPVYSRWHLALRLACIIIMIIRQCRRWTNGPLIITCVGNFVVELFSIIGILAGSGGVCYPDSPVLMPIPSRCNCYMKRDGLPLVAFSVLFGAEEEEGKKSPVIKLFNPRLTKPVFVTRLTKGGGAP